MAGANSVWADIKTNHIIIHINERLHEKTNNLHMRKQRRRPASQILQSAFVFATRTEQSLFFLNPEFQVSNLLL